MKKILLPVCMLLSFYSFLSLGEFISLSEAKQDSSNIETNQGKTVNINMEKSRKQPNLFIVMSI